MKKTDRSGQKLRLIEKMPGYYQKSKVMTQLCKSIENEFERLKSETTLTENQFFVILSDRDIKHHEEDVGLAPDTIVMQS